MATKTRGGTEPPFIDTSTLEWLGKQGARFALPRGRSKGTDTNGISTLPKDWQNKPNDLKTAITHARQGGNVGLLTGQNSGGIVAIDIDVDYPAVAESLGPYAQTVRVERTNAPSRGKFLYRVDFAVDSTAWKPPGKHKPWAELLSDGRHAIVPPSEFEGGQYVLKNQEIGIATLCDDDLALVWYKATEGRANLTQPINASEPTQGTHAKVRHDDAKALVLTAWTTFDVFDYFGLVMSVREEKNGELRLLGNGGLLIQANGEGWYNFADGNGGSDAISAWTWCKHQTPRPTGKLYWDVLREMADAKGLILPNAKASLHKNVLSGNGSDVHFNNAAPREPLPEELDNTGILNFGGDTTESDPATFDIAKVQAFVSQVQPYQGEAKRAGMEALKLLIGKLPTNERAGLPHVLMPLFADYKPRERIERFLGECGPTSDGSRFLPYNLRQIIARPPKEWYIDQLFGPGDIVIGFGPPGSAKTFAMIDLIFCGCLGRTFALRFDAQRPLNIAYCAGEGLGGLSARFAAAARYYGVEQLSGLTFFELTPQLWAVDSVDGMAHFINEWKTNHQEDGALDLLVIDTLHSATLGADENSAQDMGVILASAKMAIRELECAVLLVHHSNKSGNSERGSSALRGAADCMIEFKPAEGKFVMSCEKLKDAPAWKSQTFELVAIGESARVCWDELTDPIDIESDKGEALLTEIKKRPGFRFTTKSLAETVGCTPNATNNHLRRFVDRGEISRALQDENKPNSNRNPWVYFYNPISQPFIHSHPKL